MNSIMRLAGTYLQRLSGAVRDPEVRTQFRAVLQSDEMKTLLGTITSTLRGAAKDTQSAVQDSPQSHSTPQTSYTTP